MSKEKYFIVTLTRTIVDIDSESALEKFNYELKNQLYDPNSIEVKRVTKKEFNS